MFYKLKYTAILIIITLLLIPQNIYANTVEYRGESEGLITAPNDFFLEFGSLLPGDSKSDVAFIKNTTQDKIEVFFKTEPLDKTEYFDDIDYSLLNKIELTITLKHKDTEQEIYKGNLEASALSDYISLGEYDKNYDGEFKFEIKVPENLKNEYTLSSTKVKWVFYVEKKDDNHSADENQFIHNGIMSGNIKTGDFIFIFVVIVLIAVAVIIIVGIIRKRGKKK